MKKNLALLILPLLFLTACSHQTAEAEQIRNLLDEQEAAWNRGDLTGYMQGYWQSDSLRFAAGGSITYGWQRTLERYQLAYGDRSKMGRLSFTLLEVRVIDKQNALVFGRWSLLRSSDQPGGLFTLILKNIRGNWYIIADHTSSDSE